MTLCFEHSGCVTSGCAIEPFPSRAKQCCVMHSCNSDLTGRTAPFFVPLLFLTLSKYIARKMSGSLSKSHSHTHTQDNMTASIETRSSTPNEPQIYEELDTRVQEIRLCTVDPQSEGVNCQLHRKALESVGQYKCLSYVWGNQGEKKNIKINNTKCSVTANLYAALDGLRKELQGQPIWIDAICINQGDMKERQAQVALMADLYRNAAKVWVWLGPDGTSNGSSQEEEVPAVASNVTPNLTLAIELLQGFEEDKHFHELPYFGRCDSRACHFSQGQRRSCWTFTKALDSLELLMQTEWFSRTWTIQEIVLARGAVAFYDGQRFEWRQIRNAMLEWNKHFSTCCSECIFTLNSNDLRRMHRFAGQVLDLESAQRSLRRGDNILVPLIKFRHKNVSDPRDKIFGLLGLQSGENAITISPDYVSRCCIVYTQFARQMIESQQWIVPLHLDLGHQYRRLPSWVPDWTYCSDGPSEYAVKRYLASLQYDCAKHMSGNYAVKNDCVLELDGVEIDRITRLSCAYGLAGGPLAQIALVAKWKEFLDIHRHGKDPYVLGGSRKNAYFHAIFAGLFHSGRKIRQLTSEDIKRWTADMSDLTRELQENGTRSMLGTNQAMISQAIGSLGRRLVVTSKGYIGVCPETCEVGDLAFALSLCRAPIFLRPVKGSGMSNNSRYNALGHGYVHGVMYGEAAKPGLSVQKVLIE